MRRSVPQADTSATNIKCRVKGGVRASKDFESRDHEGCRHDKCMVAITLNVLVFGSALRNLFPMGFWQSKALKVQYHERLYVSKSLIIDF